MYLQVPNLGIEPTTFFGFWAGSGRARFASDGRTEARSRHITNQGARRKNVNKRRARMETVQNCQGARKKNVKKIVRVRVVGNVKMQKIAKSNKNRRTKKLPMYAKKKMQNHHVKKNVRKKTNVMLPKGQESSRLCVLLTNQRKKEHAILNIVDQQEQIR